METPCGTVILAQIAPIIETENRQVRRRIVNFAAILEEQEAEASAASVLDLSERGVRIKTDAKVEVGSSLLIKLPCVAAVRAKVVWSRDGETGCEFDEHLYGSTVDEIIATATPKRRRVRQGTAFFRNS
jgi:hypothetical protein